MVGIWERLSTTCRIFYSKSSLDYKKYAHPYYILTMILAISYVFLRLVRPFCSKLFSANMPHDCSFDMREHEVLMFVGCITVIKNRSAPTWQQYVQKFLFYVKVANCYLFYRQHAAYGIVYIVICILQMIFIAEPVYSGPEKVEYFSSLQNMEDTISGDKRNTWLICFYTTWSMKCIDIAPAFSEISGKYWLPNFRFGKIDVGRFAQTAIKYRINTGTWTRQLPTVILFKDGVEFMRRPIIDSQGRSPKYEFATPGIIQDFDLNNEYEACRARLNKKALQDISNDHQSGNKKRD